MIILVPTRLELQRLVPELGDAPLDHRPRAWLAATDTRPAVDVACCGFGLATAGAGAALILAGRDDEACLAGIAGTLRPEAAAIGSVAVASSIRAHGIGLPPSGRHAERDLDAELAADPSMAPSAAPAVPLALRAALGPGDSVGALLSVAVPSESAAEARRRATDHPECLVEEMEALAVLHAAALLGRPVSILRAVSNVAGERDKAAWQVDAAIAALREVLDRWLDSGGRALQGSGRFARRRA